MTGTLQWLSICQAILCHMLAQRDQYSFCRKYHVTYIESWPLWRGWVKWYALYLMTWCSLLALRPREVIRTWNSLTKTNVDFLCIRDASVHAGQVGGVVGIPWCMTEKTSTTIKLYKCILKFEFWILTIGALATVGALSYGLFSFVRGDTKMQQYMMRARVAAQGGTIVAVAGGVLYMLVKDHFQKDKQ